MATGTVVDVVMPQMGVSVSEGTITRWAKSVGETIEADETIVEISTDKVDTEVPAPATGVVRELLAGEGETVPVNTRIAITGYSTHEVPTMLTPPLSETSAASLGLPAM
jgi:2-oxoglutarate dehydrogenase E2 component (dihydrolipoamide succinyltransferase)